MLNTKLFKKGLTIIIIIAIGLPFFNIILQLFRNGEYTFDWTILLNPFTYIFENTVQLFNLNSGFAYNLICYGFSYILFINIILLILEVLMKVLGLIRDFIEKGGRNVE